MTFDFTLAAVAVWVLAALFAGFGVANLIGPRGMTDAYARWGYPRGWNLVTGTLELSAAILLVVPETTVYGIAVGGLVCLAAFATLVWHREFAHTPPSFALLVALGYLAAFGGVTS